MAERYQQPVARIWRDREVVGTGFLAPRGVVVTCAHVINDAFGRDQLDVTEPTGKVKVDLPWAAPNAVFHGTIMDWRPPVAAGAPRPSPCVDIAVLQLDPVPPVELAVPAQAPAPVREDTSFRVMGFPAGSDAGSPARGTVRGTDADGWHHVEPDRSFGRTMEPGFSGAPAIADRTGRLLGIIDITNPHERRGVLIPVEALMRAWPPLAEPYRGLEAFREEDAAYFFGRDALIQRLWRSFERNPVSLLVGPSGSGKSSLLNAGLLPRLRQKGGWRLVRFRPGDQPVKRLARELAQVLEPSQSPIELTERTAKVHDALRGNPRCLLDYAEALAASHDERICLVVDQFEETFTLARPADPLEHQAFLGTLTGVAGHAGEASLKAILGLRSDFQTNLQADRDAADLIAAVDGDPTVLLRPLTPMELEDVIRGPLVPARLDVAIEDGLLSQIITDLAGNTDALPLLEFALAELWGRMHVHRRTRSLSRLTYEELGGLSGALAQRADAALADLAIADIDAKRLFVELVRVGASADHDARRPRTKADLDALDEKLWSIARWLADRRLLVTTDGPGVDIVHEALFRQWQRLARWIEGERDFLRWRQKLEERRREWDEAGQSTSDLLSGSALDDAERWLRSHESALDARQLYYVRSSVVAEDAKRSRRAADAVWDELELDWRFTEIPQPELETLFGLGRATPEVRFEVLLGAIASVPRARRLQRQSAIVFRATLGLDRDLAARLSKMLVPLACKELVRQPDQLSALIATASFVASIGPPELLRLLITRATEAIPDITDAYQLEGFSELVRVGAKHIDDSAAGDVVTRAAAGIFGTQNPHQLRAYGEILRAFAERVDDATASDLVARAAVGIPSTNNLHQLQTYGEILRAFAERVDNATASDLVASTSAAISQIHKPHQLLAYGEMLRAFACHADAKQLNAAANKLFVCAVKASYLIQSTYELQACVEIARVFADRIDEAAANGLVAQADAAIRGTYNPHQLQAYGDIVGACAGRVSAEEANAWVTRATEVILNIKNVNQLRAYGEVVRACAKHVNEATAISLLARAVDAIPFTNHPYQLRAYLEIVHACAKHVDAIQVDAAASTLLARAAEAIPRTKNPDQLQAYSKIVSDCDGLVNPKQLEGAASDLVARAAEAILGTKNPPQLRAYAEIVRACAKHVNEATAISLLARAVDAIPFTNHPYQLRAYSEIARACARRINVWQASAWVERAIRAIPDTTNTDQLRVYGELVSACVDHINEPAASFLVESVVFHACLARNLRSFDAFLDIAISMGGKFDPTITTYVWSELLKHPLAGYPKTNEKLATVLASNLGLAAPDRSDFWPFLQSLAHADPTLQLAAPYIGPDAIIAELRRRRAACPTPSHPRSTPPRAGTPARTAPRDPA